MRDSLQRHRATREVSSQGGSGRMELATSRRWRPQGGVSTLLVLLVACLCCSLAYARPAKKYFDIPSGPAEKTLLEFVNRVGRADALRPGARAGPQNLRHPGKSHLRRRRCLREPRVLAVDVDGAARVAGDRVQLLDVAPIVEQIRHPQLRLLRVGVGEQDVQIEERAGGTLGEEPLRRQRGDAGALMPGDEAERRGWSDRGCTSPARR